MCEESFYFYLFLNHLNSIMKNKHKSDKFTVNILDKHTTEKIYLKF